MPIYSGPKTFKALENIAAGDTVYVESSEIVDRNEDYANTAAFQAVWVDSDAANKMASQTFVFFNTSQQANLTLTSVAGNNNNDYVDKTITSKNVSGYTVHFVGQASATSGDWEFLLSSGANAATSNVKQSLTFTSAGEVEHISFTVAGMTADNGSFTNTACTHVGFRCIDDTGSPTLSVGMVWWEKSGTTYYGVKKTKVGVDGSTTSGSYGTAAIGISPAAITSGNFGSLSLLGQVVSGFTGLIPGYHYYLSKTSGLLTAFNTQDPAMLDLTTGYYIMVGVAVSDTEMLIRYNNQVYK